MFFLLKKVKNVVCSSQCDVMKRYSRDKMKKACGENPEDIFSLWEENLCDVITGKEGGHR